MSAIMNEITKSLRWLLGGGSLGGPRRDDNYIMKQDCGLNCVDEISAYYPYCCHKHQAQLTEWRNDNP